MGGIHVKKVRAIILSGLLGGGLFLLLKLIIHLGLTLSLIFAILTFFIGLRVFREKKPQIIVHDQRLSKQKVSKIVFDGKRTVNKIRGQAYLIKKDTVKQEVREICDLADSIFEDFKKDPKDIKAARKFINYYLETTETIILKYIELHKRERHSEEEVEILEKVEITLAQIKETFKLQLDKLVEDDFLDLDTELAVLRKTMESEGV
jgi:5-bromo-4-chloroindolyl phosphate hydrolysis protein